ncbi:MAG: DUF5103 domain-containing protein [Flavobacteriales bacterium]|nr:DUF5103 domain-containing protein [Flavobacteriales bacterium]
MRIFLFCLILLNYIELQAQDEDFVYSNEVYDPSVETILLNKTDETADPVPLITLNSNEKLQLSFDMLRSNNEYLQYAFIHCNSDWKKSNMNRNEYLSGTFLGNIEDIQFSTNTYQEFVAYKVVFPNDDVRFTRSGNYILKVYRNFDEKDLVLTRRFMVISPKVIVKATVNSATDVRYRFSKQEVDFEVDHKNYLIPNPFIDVKATVLQNYNWSNAITDLKPKFVNNGTLIYNHEEGNLFPGGNEFRYFDIRSLRFFSLNVQKKFIDSIKNAVLKPDETRAHLGYYNQLDYNGKRAIQNKDGTQIVEDGDYALVHFYLRSDHEIHPEGVYIFGELSDWKLKEKYRMDYLPDKNCYYKAIKLKQSYYNYEYVTKGDEGQADHTFTEGDHFETENDYDIFLYHKNQQYGYDELIGYLHFNTNTNRR